MAVEWGVGRGGVDGTDLDESMIKASGLSFLMTGLSKVQYLSDGPI